MIPSDQQPNQRISSRAGIMKVAVDTGGISGNPTYEKLFEASISAAADCGVAVLAHFEKNEDAFPLVRLMERYGLPPERLIACHLDRMRFDIGYHRELAAEGIYLEYDTINRLRYHDNETEIKLILAMLGSGAGERLLLSLDTTNRRLRAYGANMGLDYILTDFAAQMRSAGVTNDEIETMMVNNPVRALSMQ
jgi:phosphotriesterase-related protein